MTNSGEPPLPTFLIIGAQKSATRWLRYNLGLHPEVFVAETELQFFNDEGRFHSYGLSWYRSQFDDSAREPVLGEATPGYMFWRHRPELCAERIHTVIPEVRLIAILRNPIDRAQSAMVHHIARGTLAPDSSLVDLVRRTPAEARFARLDLGRLVRGRVFRPSGRSSESSSSSCCTTTSATMPAPFTSVRSTMSERDRTLLHRSSGVSASAIESGSAPR